MAKFNLYLDECKSNGVLGYFVLAGIIVEEGSEYEQLTKRINGLKDRILGNQGIPLHEIEIRNAEGDFSSFVDPKIRSRFWKEFRDIYEHTDLYTICSAINCKEYKKTYSACASNSAYHVTLQMIMENFAYFLANNNSSGMVYLEKTEENEATLLQHHFHQILAAGTLYLSSTELQNRLKNINFMTKADNIVGLQMADFVPNAFSRDLSGLKPKAPSILDVLSKKLYGGGIGKPDRFGKRVLLSNGS